VLGNSATRQIEAASLGKANPMAAGKRSGANRLFINFTNVAHSAVLSKGGGLVSHAGSTVCGCAAEALTLGSVKLNDSLVRMDLPPVKIASL
jgi:hypothetical protein